jgi:hypothetical protein
VTACAATSSRIISKCSMLRRFSGIPFGSITVVSKAYCSTAGKVIITL